MKASTRIFTLLLAVLMLVTLGLPTTVFADGSTKITKSNAINSDYYYWGGQMIQYTFIYYDGTTITTNHGGFALHYAGESVTGIVGSQVAYCIEPDTGSTTGTTYNGTAAENSAYWNNKLSPQQRYAIQLILLYGAPNSLNSDDAKTLFGYEGATQILIWEIVMGLRSPTYPYTLNDSRLKNNFYSNSAFPSTKTGYDTIVAKMQAHLDIPSFASHYLNSAQTFTLDYDSASGLYKKSLTDTNGVLSKDYDFSAPGVTFSKSGNTLNISAPASAFSGGEVTATATGSSLSLSSMTQMIWTLPGKQTVTTFQASPDPVPCYFKMKIDGGTATIKKTSDTGDVSDYCFKIYKWTDNTSWYGKSDSSGNVYVTNSSYTASGTKNYTFAGLNDGTYTFLEVLSGKGKDLVFPDSWTITVKRGGSTVFNKTYTAADLTRDSNGDCRLNKISITGLNGGGVLSMTIHNAPETGDLEIVKTSTDGKIKDISFKVEQYEAEGGIGWWEMGTYKTDANGKISITGLPVGTKLRITEIVPDGYECSTDNPQTITLKRGTNTVTFTNKPTTSTCEIIKQSDDGNIKGITFTVKDSKGKVVYTGKTDKNGKISVPGLTIGETYTVIETVPENYVADKREQTIKIKEGTNSLTFVNHPTSRLELIKTSDDGNVKNISFTVEEYEPEGGIGWWTRGTYKTDADGKLDLELKYGYKYRVTETVPEDYVSENRVQEFTAKLGTNTLSFINHPIVKLDLIKNCDDGHISGIPFKFEKYDTASKKWVLMDTYRTDADGKIHLEELSVGMRLRITEIVPDGYQTEAAVQEITLVRGTNTVTFVNERINEFEIIKTADNGKVDDIEFTVFDVEGRSIVSGRTDQYGKLILRSEELQVGVYYMIMETVPEGYLCEEDAQIIQLQFGTNTVHFENRRIFGDLELIKVDESYPDTRLTGAEFTVTLTRPDGSSEAVPMPELLDDEGKGTGVYRLEHIEYGTVCVVQETKAPEGFLLSDKTFTVTIEEEKTYQIGDPGFECVTNREKSGTIQVKKVDTQGRAMPGVSFLLEFSLDGRSWAPVTYRETDSAVTAGGCTNEQLSNGILVTGRNGLAVYPGLALSLGDRVLQYRLTEVQTQDGMQLLPEPAFEGTLPYNGAEAITVTAVNAQGFVIPETGGRGFVMTGLGVFAAGSAALALLLVLKKRRGLGV